MEARLLHNEISHLTALLSLIYPGQRFPEQEGIDDTPHLRGRDPTSFPQNVVEFGDDEGEHVDETEFECELTSIEAPASDALKQRALDRLAEVLARYKTNPKNVRAHTSGSNRDAKHVASVVLVEDSDPEYGYTTFVCSKNEGLDAVDMAFLAELKRYLERAATSDKKEKDAYVDLVFDIVFVHQAPRVEFYSAILREAFHPSARPGSAESRTGDAMDLLATAPPPYKEWEDDRGLQYEFGRPQTRTGQASSMDIDCLSLQEDENNVEETLQDLRSLFNGAASASAPPKLIKSLFSVIRHPRQRPALKSLIRRAFESHEQTFQKAWSALLLLARIYYAAETLVDFAFQSKPIRLYFDEVPHTFRQPIGVSDHRRTLTEVLDSLGCLSLTPAWKEFFIKKTKAYVQIMRMKRGVHAETQLMSYFSACQRLPQRHHGDVFPYIGCSRKCCFFCEEFRNCSGRFGARGTHRTVMARWAPSHIGTSVDSYQYLALIRQFSERLKSRLQDLLSLAHPLSPGNLVQQSSAGLSTTKGVQEVEISYSEIPPAVTTMLCTAGFSAVDGQVQFTPAPDKPGYACLLRGDMPNAGFTMLPIEEAEERKINYDRETSMLEKLNDMPLARNLDRKLCRRPSCRKPAKLRCSACWTWYCSSACQRRNWTSHVFTCMTPNRPNDADYLRLIVRRVTRSLESDDLERLHDSLLELFADDNICQVFGFSKTQTRSDAALLACLYHDMLSTCRNPIRLLQESQETGTLHRTLMSFCQQCIEQEGRRSECKYICWYVGHGREDLFLEPTLHGTVYNIWLAGRASAMELLGLPLLIRDKYPFSTLQREVIELFTAISPSVWQLPDVYSSAWVNFGFCYCKTFSQRYELAGKYLDLASSEATFDDIVLAYEKDTIPDLMRSHDIDLTSLERQGVRLRAPSPCEYAVYRLMTGVEHALSGRYCECFRMHTCRDRHRSFETHLDFEAEVGYGFHLSSSWERWQLLNFYRRIFGLKGFDPQAMASAKESEDRDALENYLDSLVPNARRKLFDRRRAGHAVFPDWKSRITVRTASDGSIIPHLHCSCTCKVHNVDGPPGIFPVWRS